MAEDAGPEPAAITGRRALLGTGVAGVVTGVLGTWAVEARAHGGTPAAAPPATITGLLNVKDMGAAGDGTTDCS